MKTKQALSSKVVPFTGEFYPEVPEPMPAASNAPYLVIVAAALIGGLAIGSISTYQSADQVQLRQMKQQSEQLQQVKTQVCR
ncbi:hypothetical protein [Calothrix sp. NIES-2098]|uniref:hypothetical protein n=1 Tax=Calothrix sp. NIES-2098 TaxID=1954171 RepID=UPI000B5EB25F|nr:hypothetical protein NIES2098_34560 [Calothrix sp. NIES-2098]